MARNKGLGRGLDAIFNDNSIDQSAESVTKLPVSDIEPGKDQPRKTFDREALSQLAESVAANGVLQPILVRESENGMYSIIAGERRWRAAKMAGLSEIPAIVMEIDGFTASKIAMIENLQREDLNPCEEAKGYFELMKKYSLTQEEIAAGIGKSRSAVANSLRLLDLPEEVMTMISDKRLSAGHGRALLGLRDKSRILPLAERISLRNMSVRDAEAAVKKENASERVSPETKLLTPGIDYLGDLERKVTEILGRRCRISRRPGKHTVSFDYTDADDLDALLTGLCGRSPIED
ncbi:MAG: ParB/RepB/Spo0J family partition protein [Clostridia bacterium]|nr:ParB/RepB/Spo0J family partition protein [Clostridia bacterium]